MWGWSQLSAAMQRVLGDSGASQPGGDNSHGYFFPWWLAFANSPALQKIIAKGIIQVILECDFLKITCHNLDVYEVLQDRLWLNFVSRGAFDGCAYFIDDFIAYYGLRLLGQRTPTGARD